MPSWNELLDAASKLSDSAKSAWLKGEQDNQLKRISELRGGRNVVLYGSAFLQKPDAPGALLPLTHEELNGLMGVIYGMDWSKNLTLILHTPGGVVNAPESIVDYLRSKFGDIEVIVPTMAMSAGTMISLAADRIIMGRQSQLGPIDPQMIMAGRSVSARAIVEQFERASKEVLANLNAAHIWAPVLQSLGPALLQEAQNALDYSESVVGQWLAKYMFAKEPDAVEKGKRVAAHFNDASTHKSHGRRIGRDEASGHGVAIEHLEDSQELQEAVLTSYHLMTILFEQSAVTKLLWSSTEKTWLKNWMQTPAN